MFIPMAEAGLPHCLEFIPKHIRSASLKPDGPFPFSFSYRNRGLLARRIKERSVVSGQIKNRALGYLKTTRKAIAAGQLDFSKRD